MQNEVFNRRLFQRKDGARTRLNQLARADQPSGILASSQPLIDEAMKSVRQPETSAIPMDIAKGMSAGRADGMPMAPAPMPMPMAPPPAPMPMAPAPPPQQMAQAPQPQPSLNPMRPGVRTMQEGGEPLIEEPGFFERNIMPAIRTTSAAISEGPIGIDVTDKAGTVEGAQGLALTQQTGMELPDRELFTEEKMVQYAEIIADKEMTPKERVTALDVLAGGDPDAKDRKASVEDTLKKNKLGKINRKASFPKILADINKMVESKAGFDIAKSSNPRAAVAFAEGMSGAAQTVLGLEADKQKTAAANAETERLLRLKAALTPATTGSSLYRKAIEPNEAALKASEAVKQAYREGNIDLPEGLTIDQYAGMAAQQAYNMIVSGPGGGAAAPAAGGGAGNDPGIDLFLKESAKANPNMTEEALRTEYARLFGGTA